MKSWLAAHPRRAHAIRVARLILLAAAVMLALVACSSKSLAGLALAALLALVSRLGAGDLSRHLSNGPIARSLGTIRNLIVTHPAWTWGIFASALAAAAAVLAVPLRVSWIPVALWGSGILILIAAAWRHDQSTDEMPLRRAMGAALKSRANVTEILAVVVIGVGALLLRVWDLHGYPPFMHGDEAESAWRGLRILIGPEPLPPFITSSDWYDLPTLFHYLEAASMAVFGKDEAGVRVLAGIFGASAIPMLYAVGRLLWGRVAGFSAALMAAFSHTHIHYSRTDVFIYPSTMMALMILLIAIAYRGKRRMLTFVGMGLVIGLSQYLYSSARLLVIEGGLLLGVLLLARKIALKHALVVALAATVSAAPLMVWYVLNPATFGGRANEVFILSQPALRHTLGPGYQLPRDLGALAGIQLERIGGYLFNKGDAGGKYWPSFPAFDGVTVAALWIGVALALSRIRRFGEFAAFSWFTTGFMIGGLLTIDAPTGNRLIAAVPSVYLLGGLFFQRAADGLAGLLALIAQGRHAAIPAIAGAILVVGGGAYSAQWNLNTYFVEYPKVADPVTALITGRELAPYNRTEWRTYVMSLPEMHANYAPVKFLAWNTTPEDLMKADDLRPATDGRKTVVVALVRNFAEYEKVKARFPDGEERLGYDNRGRLILKSYRFP